MLEHTRIVIYFSLVPYLRIRFQPFLHEHYLKKLSVQIKNSITKLSNTKNNCIYLSFGAKMADSLNSWIFSDLKYNISNNFYLLIIDLMTDIKIFESLSTLSFC